MRSRRFIAFAGVTTAAAVLFGCSAETTVRAKSGDILFLAIAEPATVHMQALWNGAVVADGAGCLRLASPDRHTVVWPHGFQLRMEGDAAVVTDAAGRTIGNIGATFRFGGGEVHTLHEGISMRAVDRAAAAQRCPGPYWLVGETS